MPNNPPLVTIIIPTYNGEKTIIRAIDSVLSQTYNNFEIIMIDDGSTDETIQLVSNYINYNIRVISKANKSKGASYSRFLALQESNGEYVCNIDQDDEWPPDRLEKMINSALNDTDDDADICIHGDTILKKNTLIIKEEKRKLFQLANGVGCMGLLSIIIPPPPRLGACMFSKRSLIKAGSFEKNSEGGEDWILHAKLHDIGCKYIKCRNNVLIRHENDCNTSVVRHSKRNTEFSNRAISYLRQKKMGILYIAMFRLMHAYRKFRFRLKN
jgi:glycosyltransferase involved in cell wall biosynthesis